ncbi:NeuD/PglB/VioB family sugar acetyltransferase [Geothrix sp. PMB-07]|uniref:NeuD/PglB/VioB family sugar acetyltransferase n=1 Tax=Geothrix sp. PMB-07 TaxID=3068640 RepID=UPI0027408082|nr:NeuD/PglB/VioB family sugar acetyltransferase [Geothrix sp. PMB-07]WLT33436.1 NeuD/PglB/VioB family sugar acetyltransferase [Geothrix sp. PMB-07]
MSGLLIVGAGGHGKVVADIALSLGQWENIAFLDDLFPELTQVGDWKVIGKTQDANRFREDYPEAIVAIGANALRLEMLNRLIRDGFRAPVLIHPHASVSRFSTIGAGTVICSQSAVIIGSRIGRGAIVNTGASVGHDGILEDGVHVAPGVRLAGGVSVGECSWVGIGAVVKECLSIGSGVMIGAGSTIITDVPDGVTVVGSPAKVIGTRAPKAGSGKTEGVIRILDAALASDFDEWVAFWRRWPDREVSAHPAYVRLFTHAHDRVVGVVRETEAGGILFPLILRPIAAESWAGGQEQAWDAVTAYGYGGPFTWGDGRAGADAFWKAFSGWAMDQKIVSTFARLSLFPEQLLDAPMETVVDRSNVVRALQLDESALWMDYAHKVRKNVNKARQLGVEIRLDPEGAELDAFLKIYESTLDRREASGGYFFGRPFFESIIRDLEGQFMFFHAWLDGQIVSTELVLVAERNLYSFLGGTLAEAFHARPNDLLKHAVIEWGRQTGKSTFVLGGGWQEADGIFNYKLAFAPHGAVDFRVGKWVHDAEAYGRLLKRRSEWESAQGREWVPKAGFFPEYRG